MNTRREDVRKDILFLITPTSVRLIIPPPIPHDGGNGLQASHLREPRPARQFRTRLMALPPQSTRMGKA